jgi:hypothetical protein
MRYKRSHGLYFLGLYPRTPSILSQREGYIDIDGGDHHTPLRLLLNPKTESVVPLLILRLSFPSSFPFCTLSESLAPDASNILRFTVPFVFGLPIRLCESREAGNFDGGGMAEAELDSSLSWSCADAELEVVVVDTNDVGVPVGRDGGRMVVSRSEVQPVVVVPRELRLP